MYSQPVRSIPLPNGTILRRERGVFTLVDSAIHQIPIDASIVDLLFSAYIALADDAATVNNQNYADMAHAARITAAMQAAFSILCDALEDVGGDRAQAALREATKLADGSVKSPHEIVVETLRGQIVDLVDLFRLVAKWQPEALMPSRSGDPYFHRTMKMAEDIVEVFTPLPPHRLTSVN